MFFFFLPLSKLLVLKLKVVSDEVQGLSRDRSNTGEVKDSCTDASMRVSHIFVLRHRFQYGCFSIHNLSTISIGLTTVIGIKYASPGEGKRDSRASKVKSFVSDEYKKLVDFAALH